jgi:hypothetical protein
MAELKDITAASKESPAAKVTAEVEKALSSGGVSLTQMLALAARAQEGEKVIKESLARVEKNVYGMSKLVRALARKSGIDVDAVMKE